MIRYKSTRGARKLYPFSATILKGIAADGGLFVPEKIPSLTLRQMQRLINCSYQEQALFIINLFQPDFSREIIKKIVYSAYAANFDSKEIAPVMHLKNNQYLLELWHGPTAAFKDMALQIMPLFFVESLKKDNEKQKYLILVATSGDTGKAALEGYKNKKNVSIVVFYPAGHVSQLQERQMKTQDGKNVNVYAVHGDFDTVQTMVKDIFNDKKFNNVLNNRNNTVLSSANSINWGRLLPQIIYHISSYLDLVKKSAIRLGEQIDIAVPTGNFGNILAAFYAKRMGLPIKKLLCASNENNVLTEFLKTGVYSIKNRQLVHTPSPSMDILVASNIERLLYEITHDTKKVSRWMMDLKIKGKFTVDNNTSQILQKEFYADWISNKDCLSNIKNIYSERQYLMDPHTSVAQMVAERYIENNDVILPVVICSTAHWAKFAKDIYKALLKNKNRLRDEFDMIKKICSIAPGIRAPKSIMNLKQKKTIFNKKIQADVKSVEENIIGNSILSNT